MANESKRTYSFFHEDPNQEHMRGRLDRGGPHRPARFIANSLGWQTEGWNTFTGKLHANQSISNIVELFGNTNHFFINFGEHNLPSVPIVIAGSKRPIFPYYRMISELLTDEVPPHERQNFINRPRIEVENHSSREYFDQQFGNIEKGFNVISKQIEALKTTNIFSASSTSTNGPMQTPSGSEVFSQFQN